MKISDNLMQAIAATNPNTPNSLYRLYNMLTKYFPPNSMPVAGREVIIIAHPLQVQMRLAEGWFPGLDVNGMVTSPPGMPIQLFVNSFLLKYPRLMFITMAHEMIHVYCHWQHKQTGDIRWLDDHGPRFHRVVADAIGRGLTGIKPSQDIVELPHSYPVVRGISKTGGNVFLRLEGYDQLTANVLSQFSKQCDVTKPYFIGEKNTSIVGVFPFVERDQIQGTFIQYGHDPVLELKHEKQYDWRAE